MIRKPSSRATIEFLIRSADGRQPSFHPSKEKALGGEMYISRNKYSNEGVTAHSDTHVGKQVKTRPFRYILPMPRSKDTSIQ